MAEVSVLNLKAMAREILEKEFEEFKEEKEKLGEKKVYSPLSPDIRAHIQSRIDSTDSEFDLYVYQTEMALFERYVRPNYIESDQTADGLGCTRLIVAGRSITIYCNKYVPNDSDALCIFPNTGIQDACLHDANKSTYGALTKFDLAVILLLVDMNLVDDVEEAFLIKILNIYLDLRS